MKRREFIIRIGGATLAAPIVAKLIACGDDDGNGDGGMTGGNVCMRFEIGGAADGHVRTDITAADLASSADKTFTLSGGAHTHEFTITAAQLGMLMSGQDVTVDTNKTIGSVDHVHPLTIGGCS